MIEIKQMLVPDDKKPKYTVAGGKVTLPMKPEYITIHETDNEAAGATDEAHARLQLGGNSRLASWHIQVDDNSAIQSLPFNESAIAAGDGVNGPGNRKSIHIETCVNKGGDFKKAVANVADVTRQLMKQFNIPLCNVVQHNHWSGKNCPRHLRSGDKGVTWDDFLALLAPEPVKQKVLWNGSELKPTQIGRLTILKPINLWERKEKEIKMVRVLAPGEVYRVYGYDNEHGGQYNVGGTYITKMEGYVKYETPSKTLLERVKKNE